MYLVYVCVYDWSMQIDLLESKRLVLSNWIHRNPIDGTFFSFWIHFVTVKRVAHQYYFMKSTFIFELETKPKKESCAHSWLL